MNRHWSVVLGHLSLDGRTTRAATVIDVDTTRNLSCSPNRQSAIGNRQSPGFSLIEVTLALLILSLGVLCMLGLFPAGVKMSRDAYEETRIAQFAESVLNAIDVELRLKPELWETDSWLGQVYAPGQYGAGSYQFSNHVLTAYMPHFGINDGDTKIWADPDKLKVYITEGSYRTNVYRAAFDTNLVDFALRYELSTIGVGADKKMIEALAAPMGWHLYNDNPACGWISAGDKVAGIDPPRNAPEGIPPWETDFFSLQHNNPREYRNMADELISFDLRVMPGQFGPTYNRLRYFYRYYYKYN